LCIPFEDLSKLPPRGTCAQSAQSLSPNFCLSALMPNSLAAANGIFGITARGGLDGRSGKDEKDCPQQKTELHGRKQGADITDDAARRGEIKRKSVLHLPRANVRQPTPAVILIGNPATFDRQASAMNSVTFLWSLPTHDEGACVHRTLAPAAGKAAVGVDNPADTAGARTR
jgi:hypothetical protein